MGNANVWAPETKISGNMMSVPQSFTLEANQVQVEITKFKYAIDTGALEVYKNGLLLDPETDYVEVNESQINLLVSVYANDRLVVIGKVGITGEINFDFGETTVIETQATQYGDGTETVFNSPASDSKPANHFIVVIGGGYLATPGTDYTINANGKVVFTSAPDDGVSINIRYFKPVTVDTSTDITQESIGEFAPIRVRNIAVLREVIATYDNQIFEVLGHTNDGVGGGTFYYDADDTTSTDDDGIVIVSDGGQRFKRITDYEGVDITWYGIEPTAAAEDAVDCYSLIDKLLAAARTKGTSDSGITLNPTQGLKLRFPRIADKGYYLTSCTNGTHVIDFDNMEFDVATGVTLLKDSNNVNGYPAFKVGAMVYNGNGSRNDASSKSAKNTKLGNLRIRCEDRQTGTGNVDGCALFIEDASFIDFGSFESVMGLDARTNGVNGGILIRRAQHVTGYDVKSKFNTNYAMMIDSRDDATAHFDWGKLALGLRGDTTLGQADKNALIVFRSYSQFSSSISGFHINHLDGIENSGSASPVNLNAVFRVDQYDNPNDLNSPAIKNFVVDLTVDSAMIEGFHTIIDDRGTNSSYDTNGNFVTFNSSTRRKFCDSNGGYNASLTISSITCKGGKTGNEPFIDWQGDLHVGAIKQQSAFIAEGELFNVDFTKATFTRDFYETAGAKFYTLNNIVRGDDLTISGGVINLQSNYHRVLNEGGATLDEIDTINPPPNVRDGDIFILRSGSDSQDNVYKHNTGNLWLDGKVDKTLDRRQDRIVFQWDADFNTMQQIAYSDNR